MTVYIHTADDWATALHEAAHAVAFHLCGVAVRRIVLNPSGYPDYWTGQRRLGCVEPVESPSLAADLIATHAGPANDAALGCYDPETVVGDNRFINAQHRPYRDAAGRVAVRLIEDHHEAINAVAGDLIAAAYTNGFAELGRRAARESLERHAGNLGLYDPDQLIAAEMTEAEQRDYGAICAAVDTVQRIKRAQRAARRALRRSVFQTDAEIT